MNARDRAAQVFCNRLKRGRQRLAAGEDHIVVAWLRGIVGEQTHRFAQSSANAIAFDGSPDLLRDGEAEPRRLLAGSPLRRYRL